METEKRLIDANDALERLKKAEKEMKVVSLCGCKAVPMDGVIDFVASRPTVYAVEVVRCEKCAFGKGSTYKTCPLYKQGLMKDDDFCSKGESKTENM